MFLKAIGRLKSALVSAIAILLFSAIIAMIICILQASNEAELLNYEEAYQSVPVTITVTMTEPREFNTDLGSVQNWVFYLFTAEEPVEFFDVSAAEDTKQATVLKREVSPTELSLSEYVKDVQVKMSQGIKTVNDKNFNGASGASMLIGITSLSCDKQLLSEYGCEIKWYEGYNESIFAGEELVCIVPEDMAEPGYYDNGNGEAVLNFSGKGRTPTYTLIDGKYQVEFEELQYQCTLKIVGTYTAGDDVSIYCPFPIIEQVYEGLERELRIDSLSATLADNRRLEEFREKASMFFMDPSQKDEEVPWGIFLINRSTTYKNDFYRYAIDINDEIWAELSAILEDSIKFNRTVTLIVVALSAVSGFLVGFLMIRRRKREIMLMRMVGESNARVYVGFVLEQMICIILGVIVGGAYYMWKPMDNLSLFVLTYFVGLSIALVIFMSKKLIKYIKEDE